MALWNAEAVDEVERHLRDIGRDDLDALALALSRAWQHCWPSAHRPWRWWLELFLLVGFTRDGVRDETARPADPMPVYRGGPAGRLAEGHSWTTTAA